MKIVAKMGHWSSVVGGGVLLTDDKGRRPARHRGRAASPERTDQ